MADQKISDLQRVTLFAQCSKAELQSLAQNCDEVDLPDGKTLITQGRPHDTFYLLLEGRVEVAVAGEQLRYLEPGDIFGEMSMLDRGPATATVTTRSPMRALVMSHAQFQTAIQANDKIALKVIAVMAQRLRHDPRVGR
ncbi:MAG: cyclic nucleotide-binding domain-containing protein [Chloroflexota bacterium]|nr:cyclic nucleotide-binding domain-containing protein [Chloroflexota bacterium]